MLMSGINQITRMMRNQQLKPPNILIYCKENSLYEKAEKKLLSLLEDDVYIVYHLRDISLSAPWRSNCAAIMLLDSPSELNEFNDYYKTGGKLFSFQTKFDSNLISGDIDNSIQESNFITTTCKNKFQVKYSGHLYTSQDKQELGSFSDEGSEVISLINQSECSNSDSAVISTNNGFTTLSRIGLLDLPNEVLKTILINADIAVSSKLCEIAPKISETFHLFTNNESDRNIVLEKLKRKGVYKNNDDIQISFDKHTSNSEADIINIASSEDSTAFDIDSYRRSRGSKGILGRSIIYAEVVKTTTTILECVQNKLKDNIGLVTIASRQTKGLGRSGNKWLSPLGCAMCSLHAKIPRQQDLIFLQHYVALALVDSIRSRQGYEDLDIRIKWPNDIYTNRNYKLGGVLVKTSISGSEFEAFIGIGINVDNELPSICINDVIERYNKENEKNLQLLSREDIIGGIISTLDQLIYSKISTEQFLEKYYSYWLHGQQKIHLDSENGREAIVIGLDEYGYLKVKLTKNDEIITVFPDGNSFDMMSNLIVPKI